MRTSVSETSLSAYRSLSSPDYLQPKEAAIMRLFGFETRLSRQQISEMGNMPINCVCGRVNSLVASGRLIEQGERTDPFTGKKQKLLQLPTGQGRLF